MENIKKLLYYKATNRSSSKTPGVATNTTPKMDKVSTPLAEVDIAYNLQYNTVALKAFYQGNKKSYKLDIPLKDAQSIVDKLRAKFSSTESILDIVIEAGWEDLDDIQ